MGRARKNISGDNQTKVIKRGPNKACRPVSGPKRGQQKKRP